MNPLRLLLLFLLGLMLRRLLRPIWRRRNRPNPAAPPKETAGREAESLADLTEQGIDDADFEEIP